MLINNELINYALITVYVLYFIRVISCTNYENSVIVYLWKLSEQSKVKKIKVRKSKEKTHCN